MRRNSTKRYLHLVKCNKQGQCNKCEEKVVQGKLKWQEVWLIILFKSTNDILSTTNQKQRIFQDVKSWEIIRNANVGTIEHYDILSAYPLGLHERYTLRQTQVLSVIVKFMKDRIRSVNARIIPTKVKREKEISMKEIEVQLKRTNLNI